MLDRSKGPNYPAPKKRFPGSDRNGVAVSTAVCQDPPKTPITKSAGQIAYCMCTGLKIATGGAELQGVWPVGMGILLSGQDSRQTAQSYTLVLKNVLVTV